MKHTFTALLILFSAYLNAATFEIIDLNNTNGVVRCALYKDKSGFPDNPEKASLIVVSQIHADKKSACTFDLNNETAQFVAVAILHDEDMDGKMKTNLIGIPREGWAVSNNASARKFGPPTFDDAKFDPKKVSQQTLKVNY